MKRFIRIRPHQPQIGNAIGERFRVSRDGDELTEIAEEKTLPERVDSTTANHVTVHDSMWLTQDDVRWLHAALADLIEEFDHEEAVEILNTRPQFPCATCGKPIHPPAYLDFADIAAVTSCLDCTDTTVAEAKADAYDHAFRRDDQRALANQCEGAPR